MSNSPSEIRCSNNPYESVHACLYHRTLPTKRKQLSYTNKITTVQRAHLFCSNVKDQYCSNSQKPP